MRPARVSGVVFGSEIMKNAKMRNAPLVSRWSGIASGSPSHTERPTSIAAYASTKAAVTSTRDARVTTMMPREAMSSASNAASPHWPGETHAPEVASTVTAMPTLVGLKTCFAPTRMANLLAMVMTAAYAAMNGDSVRSSRHSESAEMRALLKSTRLRSVATPELRRAGSEETNVRQQSHCVVSETVRSVATISGRRSKRSQNTPYASSVARAAI